SIVNGGFESQDVGSASYYPLPSNSYWTFSGDSGIASNGGVPGTNLNAPEGSQVGVLSAGGSSATISQSFDPGAGSTSVHFKAANAQDGATPSTSWLTAIPSAPSRPATANTILT